MSRAKRATLSLALVLLTLACGATRALPAAPPPVDSSYAPLFDGRDLAGWDQIGGGQDMDVWFKDVELLEIPGRPKGPPQGSH